MLQARYNSSTTKARFPRRQAIKEESNVWAIVSLEKGSVTTLLYCQISKKEDFENVSG